MWKLMLTLYLYYQPSDFSLLVKSRELVLFVLIIECKALGMPTIQEVLNKWSLSFYCSLPLPAPAPGSIPHQGTSLVADLGFPFIYSSLSQC